MGNPLLFGETDFTFGFTDPMFPIRCATIVQLRLQQMGDFCEKLHFTMQNRVFKIFAANYKVTPLRQIWSNKSFGAVLTLYGGEKKSTRESPLENGVVYNVVYRDVVMLGYTSTDVCACCARDAAIWLPLSLYTAYTQNAVQYFIVHYTRNQCIAFSLFTHFLLTTYLTYLTRFFTPFISMSIRLILSFVII